MITAKVSDASTQTAIAQKSRTPQIHSIQEKANENRSTIRVVVCIDSAILKCTDSFR